MGLQRASRKKLRSSPLPMKLRKPESDALSLNRKLARVSPAPCAYLGVKDLASLGFRVHILLFRVPFVSILRSHIVSCT